MPLNRSNDFDPGLPPAEYALPEAPGAEFMDIPKAFGAGVGEGTATLGKGLESTADPIRRMAEKSAGTPAAPYAGMATAGGALGNVFDELGTELGNFFKEHMSEGGQKVMDTPLYQEGHFTDTAKNPLNWPIVAADAVGQTAPVLAASAAGGVPMATMAGFAQNAGGISDSVHNAIMQSDDNQLMQSPTFVSLFKNIDQDPQYSGYSDLQKIDLAKKQLADTVAMADLGDPKMLAANLVASYTGDAYLGELFAGRMLSSSVAKTAGKAILRDGGINAGFAGISQLTENQGMALAGSHGDVDQGVNDQMITGGLTGIAMGGVPAIVGHVREGMAARREGQNAGESEEPATPAEDKAEKAVDDIETGAQEVQQGMQDLKEGLTPEPHEDMFSKGLGEEGNTSTEPPAGYRTGLSPEQAAEQERLAAGFSDREKFGGNGPDDFADIPAYMRAGKTVHADPDSRPFHLVDSAGPEGRVKARFDDKNDAEFFRYAQLLDQYTRGNHPDPDEAEHQAVKDWFYRMTRGVKREDAETPKKRKRGKKSPDVAEAPKREPRSDFEAKNIFDTIMGYYQYVQDVAKDAHNGEFTAPSMGEYADHRFPDRPLQIEDKNIIFAGGPNRYLGEPLGDERQAGGGPEFRAGERVRPDYIPADRSGSPVRAINTIEGEARRVIPAIEDKNIIFSGAEGTDEGQRGAPPQFEGGRTKARRRLDRFEERMGSKQKYPELPQHQLPSGKITPSDSVNDAARSGNGELYMRRNGKPFPSEGLARLSKPYEEAKKTGKKPKVVKVDGGYAVDVPDKKEKPAKKAEPVREPDKPKDSQPETLSLPKTDITISSHDQHASFFRNLIENPDAVTPNDVRAALDSTLANKEPILQGLNKLTKKQLEPFSGRYVPSDVKKDRLVANAWDSLVNDFRWLTNKGPTMVTYGNSRIEDLARDAMKGITQSDINEYADSVKQARAERQQRAEAFRSAIEAPKTLDDFRAYLRTHPRLEMEAAGHDGILINDAYEDRWLDDPDYDEEDENYDPGPKTKWAIAFSPEQIKSAVSNNGEFSASNPDINFSKVARSAWDDDFPDTVLHGRLGDATAHKDYEAAKGGDDAAARRLVADVMTRQSVDKLRQLLNGRKAILAAVHAEEAVSRNAIPQAMADVLGKVLDLEVDPYLLQAAKVGRTAQDGFGRLTNQPAFEGPVRTDLPYILLDDTLTQGGTLANLKGYIENHGGKVIGTSALTGKRYSAKIALAAETLDKLRNHFEGTDLENWWNEQHGYGFDRLTESEANYLIRAADADKIRDRVLAARQDGAAPAQSESLRDNGSVPPDVNNKFSRNASEFGGVFASGSPRERIRSGVADYQPRGLSKKQVEDEAAQFLKKWNGAGGIAVQVAKDMAEAEQLAGFPLPDALIHAMHLPNSSRIILVAKNLDSLSHVRAKLRHEILGHHALSEVVGPAEYDKLLRAVAAGQNSKSLKPYFDRVIENYEGADPWKQVEEVISHVIEDGERGFLGRAWDRVSGAVLQALRKSGFLSDENITAGEVRGMMAPIAKRLKNLGDWAEKTDKARDLTVNFSLTGKDGLFSKPLPGETETEATQRRSKNFGRVVHDTVGNVHNLRPTDIIKRLTSNLSSNALMIGTLTNRQLAAVYNKLMKTDYAGQYQDLQAKMEARRNRIMNSAERGIENQWNKLSKDESRSLSDLMVDATMTRVHPDKPLAEQDRFQNLKNEQTLLRSSKSSENKEEAASRLVRVSADLDAMRENYNDLHSRWMKLSPEAKELWHDTEKWYKNSYADLKEALIQRINDVGGDQNAALISRVREQFERALKDGPYFPLARFGKYVVTARKDGDYIREHFETRSAALAALEAYRKDGYEAVQSVKAKDNGKNNDSAHSLGKEILELLNKSEDGSLNKEQLTDQVWQTMLELMPDASYARHFIRRRRVKGASHDARRAFANSAFHFAHHVSKIEYGHKMQAVLDDMGNEIDAAMKGDYSGVQPDNLETAQRMLDELKMRHDMTMNPSGDGFGNALTGTGYVFNMAANPSSAIINMTQTALVALPQLAARYGWKNAMKAMGAATADYFRSADKRFKWFGKGSSWLDRDAWLSMSRSNRLNADELELMKRLNEDGVISITQASSLAQRAESGTQDKIHFNKALDMSILVGGQLFHNIEVANREVTALAAYRLAKDAAGGRIDPVQAYKVASNAVYDAHFDYSSSNRPRWMRQSWQKVLFQFKMYAQHMFYTLGRSFTQSFKGETPEIRRQAQKEFLGYMLMHTLAAGVTGLPYAVQAIFGAAAQGIHAAVSDNDSPWDPEVALKNWLTDELGGFASTAITDGVVNALGIDLHSRVGIQDLLWRSPPEGTEGKDLYVYYMEQMLGPTIGGIGLNFANGYDKMAKGDWLGGIQTVTPAAVKNLVKTYSEATNGVTTSSGEEVVPADEFSGFELAAQAFGFSPSRIGQAYDARTAIKNVQSDLSGRRTQLLQRYFANAMSGDDNSDVLEDIQAYNRSNPTNAITGEVIVKAIRQKQKARLKKERGLALSRKDEHLRALGRFGNYDPIL
ncbi:PLxRFG domain-containing protein [Salmonella enterica]|nr:PLxRFG domain-containing protein [Salmonella enterica]EGA9875480.1 PLxRFG domain-containing protein [Salmonella enterica]EGM0290056.1 PLxRFG domain-containing protein [Salmonella enterica]